MTSTTTYLAHSFRPTDVLDRTDLVARLRAREESAVEDLFREFGPGLLAAARSILGCEHAAQDALQEGVISALRAIHTLEKPAALGAWLRRTVSNAALARLRMEKSRRTRSIDELLPRFLDDGHRADVAPTWVRSKESESEKREMVAFVRTAMRDLPERYREVLTLRDMLGLDTKGTADSMGITTANVKVLLHRARQALRTLLEERLSTA